MRIGRLDPFHVFHDIRIGVVDQGTHARQHIAGYKCPKSYEFRDKLPLTAAGKVQKTELRKTVAQGRAA